MHQVGHQPDCLVAVGNKDMDMQASSGSMDLVDKQAVVQLLVVVDSDHSWLEVVEPVWLAFVRPKLATDPSLV